MSESTPTATSTTSAPVFMPPPRGSLLVFDIVGFAFGVLGLLWSAAAAIEVQPTFAKMFEDFGQQLPAFTKRSLKPWFPVLLGLIPLVIVGEGVIRSARRTGRAARMGVAIFLTLALPGIFWAGMYLPIFSITSAVK